MDGFGINVAHLEKALDNCALGLVLQITKSSQHHGGIPGFVRLVSMTDF